MVRYCFFILLTLTTCNVFSQTRANVISFLVQPFGERSYYAVKSSNVDKLRATFLFSTKDMPNPDSCTFQLQSMLDLFWGYVAKDSAAYYDTVRVIVIDTGNSVLLNYFSWGEHKITGDIYERLSKLRDMLYMPSTIAFVPGEKRNTQIVEISLYTENCALDNDVPSLFNYANVVATVVSDYVLQRDYKHFPFLIIRLCTKNNSLISRLKFMTKDITLIKQ
jgi:hypothetical protein